jgi:hypothetical protein
VTVTIYKEGTISVGLGQVEVVGLGTAWLTAQIKAGDTLYVGGVALLVEDVTDQTHLTLALPCPVDVSGEAYAIAPTSAYWATVYGLNQKAARMIQLLAEPRTPTTVALGDEETPVIIGERLRLRAPEEVDLIDVRATINEPSAQPVEVMLRKNGVDLLTASLVIAAGDVSTYGTPAAVDPLQARIADDDMISAHVLSVGDDAVGLKLSIYSALPEI